MRRRRRAACRSHPSPSSARCFLRHWLAIGTDLAPQLSIRTLHFQAAKMDEKVTHVAPPFVETHRSSKARRRSIEICVATAQETLGIHTSVKTLKMPCRCRICDTSCRCRLERRRRARRARCRASWSCSRCVCAPLELAVMSAHEARLAGLADPSPMPASSSCTSHGKRYAREPPPSCACSDMPDPNSMLHPHGDIPNPTPLTLASSISRRGSR